MADERLPQPLIVNPAPVQVSWDLAKYLDNLGTRLDGGFARVETKLDGKADKSDLAAINARLDEHGREIGRLKDRQREDEAAQSALSQQNERSSSAKQRRWNLMMSAALVVVTALGVMAAVLHW